MKSLIIGGLVGVGVAGAARMFHAPTVQGMGAFRTLGELNSLRRGPRIPLSFGLGFFNAWASTVAAWRLHPGRGSPHPAELVCSP